MTRPSILPIPPKKGPEPALGQTGVTNVAQTPRGEEEYPRRHVEKSGRSGGRRPIAVQDLQVEIVAGGHAVARVCGALLVDAHRGRTRLTPEEPAALALHALGAIARDGQRLQPSGAGPPVAREAARGPMTRA